MSNEDLGRLCGNIEELEDKTTVLCKNLEADQCRTDQKMKDTLLLKKIVEGEVKSTICCKEMNCSTRGLDEGLLVPLLIHISSPVNSIMKSDLLVLLQKTRGAAPSWCMRIRRLECHCCDLRHRLFEFISALYECLNKPTWSLSHMRTADLICCLRKTLKKLENRENFNHLVETAGERAKKTE